MQKSLYLKTFYKSEFSSIKLFSFKQRLKKKQVIKALKAFKDINNVFIGI